MKPREDSENQSHRLGKAELPRPKLPSVFHCSRSDVSRIQVWTNQSIYGFLDNYILRVTQETLRNADRLKTIFLGFTGNYLLLNIENLEISFLTFTSYLIYDQMFLERFN